MMDRLMKDSITSRNSKHSREQNSSDSNFGFIFPGQNASLQRSPQQSGSRHEKLRNQSRQKQSRHRRAEKYQRTDSQDSLNFASIQRER